MTKQTPHLKHRRKNKELQHRNRLVHVHFTDCVFKTAYMANRLNQDQMPRSAPFDLSLHFVLPCLQMLSRMVTMVYLLGIALMGNFST